MARDGTADLQVALYERLNGAVLGNLAPGAGATPVSVFDHVPGDATPKPYVVIGDAEVDDFGTKDDVGTLSTVELDVYTEYRGRLSGKRIARSIYDLLHEQALDVDGQQCVLVRFEHANHTTEADGLTRRSTLRYTVMLFHL